jgi:hypothetical protein
MFARASHAIGRLEAHVVDLETLAEEYARRRGSSRPPRPPAPDTEDQGEIGDPLDFGADDRDE